VEIAHARPIPSRAAGRGLASADASANRTLVVARWGQRRIEQRGNGVLGAKACQVDAAGCQDTLVQGRDDRLLQIGYREFVAVALRVSSDRSQSVIGAGHGARRAGRRPRPALLGYSVSFFWRSSAS